MWNPIYLRFRVGYPPKLIGKWWRLLISVILRYLAMLVHSNICSEFIYLQRALIRPYMVPTQPWEWICFRSEMDSTWSNFRIKIHESFHCGHLLWIQSASLYNSFWWHLNTLQHSWSRDSQGCVLWCTNCAYRSRATNGTIEENACLYRSCHLPRHAYPTWANPICRWCNWKHACTILGSWFSNPPVTARESHHNNAAIYLIHFGSRSWIKREAIDSSYCFG